jgi:signal transduction histidine kinase
VTAEVSDTGRGFELDAEMARGGLGLFGMQERAGYIGGRVEIDSARGSGTRVRVSIPTTETTRYV